MDENKTLSPEELKAEEEALREVKEDEVREKVIAEYGFDEVDDSDRIDKLVKERVGSQKNLSQAIGQKIKYRTELQKKEEKPKEELPPKDQKKDIDPEELDKTLEEKVQKQLEKRDLDSLDYPDELKADIQRVAQIKGISIKQAVSDPYIAFKIEAVEKEKETEEATASRTNKKGGKTEYSLDNPPDVDVTTEEGQKKWEKWKEEMRKKHPTASL